MAFGKGYSTELGPLQITVEVREIGWGYWIQRGGKEVAHHDPCWLWNQTDENAKIEAVAKALELLGQLTDPADVSSKLAWEPYGPGDQKV